MVNPSNNRKVKQKMTEFQNLQLRWRNKTGEDMPSSIARQPLEVIEKAVRWCEKGIVPVIPPVFAAVDAGESRGSMQEWDGHNNLK